MLNNIRTAVVQFEPKSFKEKQYNAEFIIDKIKSLGDEKDLIVFPELSLNNFFEIGPDSKKEYWNHAETINNSKEIAEITGLAKKKNVHIVIGASEKSERIGDLYNSAILITPEESRFIYRKIHLPGNEKFYFTAGNEISVFDTKLGKIGLCICYDLFFPEIARILAIKGAEIIICICSVWKGGSKGGIGSGDNKLAISKDIMFDLLPVIHASSNQTFFIEANGCGKLFAGKDLGYWERMGKSKIVDPFGNVLAKAGDSTEVIEAELKYDDLLAQRTGFNFFMDRIPWKYKDISENRVH